MPLFFFMKYFEQYEARRKLYGNIKPGSLWRWNETTDEVESWLSVVKIENNQVYYRYINSNIPMLSQGTFQRTLYEFPKQASPFVPVIELTQ